MTAPVATDAIERWLASFTPWPRCAVGLAGLAVGVAAALLIARRWLPAIERAPRPSGGFLQRLSQGGPRSFRLELLPTLLLVWIAASIVAPRVVGSQPGGGAPLDLRVAARQLLFVGAVVVLFLVAWTRRLGDGLADLSVTTRRLGATLLATLAFYVAFFPAQIGAGALESGVCELFGRTPAFQEAVLAFARDPTLAADPIVLAAIVLVVPLYEELLFRGVLLRYLQRLAPTGLAIVLDAALFAGVHPGGLSAVFVLGGALAWLMASTRSFAAPLCFHVVHNGLVLILIATTSG